MRVAAYIRQPAKPHEEVANAVVAGVRSKGDMAWTFGKGDPMRQENADVVVIFGIGGDARQVWDANSHARRVLLDKPYTRGGVPGPTRYHLCRVSVDALHPTSYFRQIARPPDRWNALKFPDVEQYKFRDQTKIVFDGASNKYCLWEGLPDWPVWGQMVVSKIRQHTRMSVVYRPRPSHNPAPILEGVELSEGPIEEDFRRARVVVSHGGNIGFDCVVRGVPHFAIGDSAARSLSETDWREVERPRFYFAGQRAQWLADIAYCQWNLDEFADGRAWRYVRETLDLTTHLKMKARLHATP